MNDFATRSGVCSPLVALLTSPAVDSAFEKNALTLADALMPFSLVQISIKDPLSGHQLDRKIRVDIRDVRKGAFLLSHTCLPYVLQESLSCSLQQQEPSEGAEKLEEFSAEFVKAFLTVKWFGPADHDYLRSYVCCLFVASTSDTNPLEELDRLQQLQRAQQQGDSSVTLGPSYCCPAKWMGPNILSYFVLLHDTSAENDERAKETFTAVCSRYGMQFCHLLRINSAHDTDSMTQMPDPWARVVEQRYRGFNRGLELARQALLERAAETNNIDAQDANPEQAMSQLTVSTASRPGSSPSSLFTTSSALQLGRASRPTARFNGHIEVPNISTIQVASLNHLTATNEHAATSASTCPTPAGAYSPVPSMLAYNNTGAHGRLLDTADRERLRDFIEEFVRTALVPYVEKQISTQGEIITNRKGLGKSITSMRKWLSATTAAAAAPYGSGASITSSPVSSSTFYGPESNEQQTRRLADMALQFGLYGYANQLYQSLKKDFANDQAWLHHAGALEMSAVSYFLNSLPSSEHSPTTTRQWLHSIQKNYPLRYVEGAINYYTNVCMQPMLAMRCAVLGADILSSIGLHSEAATQLLSVSGPSLSDFFNAIDCGYAAQLFEKSRRVRRGRTTFYAILAAHRFSKAGLTTLAYHHYQKGFRLLHDKEWNLAESHVLLNIASNKPEIPSVGVPSLANLKSLAASGEQQQQLLSYYVMCLKSTGQRSTLVLPYVNAQDITVFYGHAAKASYDASRYVEFPSPPFQSDELRPLGGEEADSPSRRRLMDSETVWERLEEAARVPDSATPPRRESQRAFSNKTTDNSKVAWTATLEPTIFRFRLTNPLSVPLTLRDVALGVGEVKTEMGAPIATDSAFQSATCIPEVLIPAGIEGSGEVVVEFSLTPSKLTRCYSIDKLRMRLCAADDLWVDGYLPLEIAGRRLTSTKEQRVSKARVPDNRLKLAVDDEPYPQLEFRINAHTEVPQNHHIIGYCDQLYDLTIEVHNKGVVPVNGLRISIDQPEVVFISQRENGSSEAAGDEEWVPCQAHPVSADDASSKAAVVYACDGVALLPSIQTSLRLTVHAPSKPTTALPVHILFFYHAEGCNGGAGDRRPTRQFRYRFFISAQPLLEASVRSLNSSSGLCALRLHLLANDLPALSRLELLRIKPILSVLLNNASSEQFIDVAIRERPANTPSTLIRPMLDRGEVLLESGQRLDYCFRFSLIDAEDNKRGGVISEIWLGEHLSGALPPRYAPIRLCDLSTEGGPKKRFCGRGLVHLQIAILWRATVTSSEDGKANMVMGETILPNPFVHFRGAEGENSRQLGEIGGWSFVMTNKDMNELTTKETTGIDSAGAVNPPPQDSIFSLMDSTMPVFQIPWKSTSPSR